MLVSSGIEAPPARQRKRGGEAAGMADDIAGSFFEQFGREDEAGGGRGNKRRRQGDALLPSATSLFEHLKPLFATSLTAAECRAVDVAGDPPEPRCFLSLTPIRAGAVMMGGRGDAPVSNTVYLLDAAARQWSPLGRLPMAQLHGHAAAFVAGESDDSQRLFVFGGVADGALSGELHCYELQFSRWSRLEAGGSRPGPRANHSLVAIRGSLLAFGGLGDGVAYDDAFRFDVTGKRWMRLRTVSQPQARGYHSAHIYKTYMIVFGGADFSTVFNDVWALDLSNLHWHLLMGSFSPKCACPRARMGHASAVVCDELIVVGGQDPATNTTFGDVWSFNLRTQLWAQIRVGGDPLPPLFGAAMCERVLALQEFASQGAKGGGDAEAEADGDAEEKRDEERDKQESPTVVLWGGRIGGTTQLSSRLYLIHLAFIARPNVPGV